MGARVRSAAPLARVRSPVSLGPSPARLPTELPTLRALVIAKNLDYFCR